LPVSTCRPLRPRNGQVVGGSAASKMWGYGFGEKACSDAHLRGRPSRLLVLRGRPPTTSTDSTRGTVRWSPADRAAPLEQVEALASNPFVPWVLTLMLHEGR
jgi:hypothetical protein